MKRLTIISRAAVQQPQALEQHSKIANPADGEPHARDGPQDNRQHDSRVKPVFHPPRIRPDADQIPDTDDDKHAEPRHRVPEEADRDDFVAEGEVLVDAQQRAPRARRRLGDWSGVAGRIDMALTYIPLIGNSVGCAWR